MDFPLFHPHIGIMNNLQSMEVEVVVEGDDEKTGESQKLVKVLRSGLRTE